MTSTHRDSVAFGMGTYGSRSLAVGGSAIVKSIEKIIETFKIRYVALAVALSSASALRASRARHESDVASLEAA